VSITKRILEGAQSGLSRLTSLVIVDDEPLSHVETAALQVELTARKAAREKATRQPLDNPLARMATSDPAARAARDKAARERSAPRPPRSRRARGQAEAAADEQFRRMKEQAARGGGTYTSSSSTASSSSTIGDPAAPAPGSSEAKAAEWYRILDLQPARTWRRSRPRTAS